MNGIENPSVSLLKIKECTMFSDSDPGSVTVSKQQCSYRNSKDNKTPVLHTLVIALILSCYVTLI